MKLSKMKRLKDITVGVVLGGVLFSGVAYAATSSIEVEFLPLKYLFDGVEKKAPEGKTGFIYDGSTYVPLRFAAESLGKSVVYDDKNLAIHIGNADAGSSVTKKPAAEKLTDEQKLQNLVSSTNQHYGEAGRGEKVDWWYKIQFTKYDATTGKFEGQIEWLNLNAINKIEGQLSDKTITFKETEKIKAGNAVLGPEYTLTIEGDKLSGTWKLGTGDENNIWFSANDL
jgi:hypothetical protein